MPKVERHYALYFADGGNLMDKICPDRSTVHAFYTSCGDQTGNDRHRAGLRLCCLEYRHFTRRVAVLAAASYFTPVLSSALAAAVLSAPLSFSFWRVYGLRRIAALLVGDAAAVGIIASLFI
jgi:hypothetical protein